MRHILTATAILASLTLSAGAAPRVPNYCATQSEATCGSTAGCSWRTADSWTRQSDGKVRAVRAKCAYDAKAAKAALSAMVK